MTKPQFRFFLPQSSIEHVHTSARAYMGTWDGKGSVPVDAYPPQFEILVCTEQWGYIPVMGSGRTTKSAIPEGEGRRVCLLTQEERDAFMAQYFPYTWEYEEEKRNESLTAACV